MFRQTNLRFDLWVTALLSCWLVPTVALAQAPSPGDQTERPSAAVCQVLFDSDNVGVGLTMCLIEDKATFLDQSTHTECQDHDNGTMTTHTIFVSVGAGSVKVWGVSVRTGVVSNPSEFGKTCEDIPFMPFLISGHPLLEDGLS